MFDPDRSRMTSIHWPPTSNLGLSFLVFVFLSLAAPVLAEREVHVVAIGKGYQTDDFYALPEARVLVDRPGQDVSLVLLDGGLVHWQVEATEGTVITEVFRSGPSSKDSKVSLSGIPMVGLDVPALPLVFAPWGRKFRTLVDALAQEFGTERISSFQAAHQAYTETLIVDHVDTVTAGLTRDYLAQHVRATDDLPPEIGRWIEKGGVANDITVSFDVTGISLADTNGTRQFPVTPNVPDILLPVMAVYDPGSQMIYGITYGGEGFVYSVDVRTGEWGVVTSLEEYDPAGLLYDPKGRTLILTGAFSRPGEIKVIGLDGGHSSLFVPTTGFPGLTDLFDYGNEHGPPLTPRAFADGWLMLEASSDHDNAYRDAGQFRLYALSIKTGEVRLLGFRN